MDIDDKDMQSFISELSGTEATPPADPAPEDSKPDKEPETLTSEDSETITLEDPNADPAPEDASDTDSAESRKDPEKEEKTNAAFARLRAENSTYKRALKAFALANNISEEEAVQQLEAQALEKQAKEKNVDPEVLREMEDLRNYNRQMLENLTLIKLKQLQDSFSLKDEELTSFAESANAAGINLFETSIDLQVLYKALNYDKLQAKAIKEAEQAWIKRQEKADKAPSLVRPGTGDPANDKKDVKSISDLDRLLSQLKS